MIPGILFSGHDATSLMNTLGAILGRLEDPGLFDRRISAHSSIPLYNSGSKKCTQGVKLETTQTI